MNVAAITGRLPLPESVKQRLPVPTEQVAVVRLEGVITPAGAGGGPGRRGGITLEGLESALTKAFGLPGLKAVALSISSRVAPRPSRPWSATGSAAWPTSTRCR